jgi:predicted permease
MSLLSRLTSVFRSRKLDQDLEDELRSHLEMRAEDNIEAGMSEGEARQEAARKFGNPTLVHEYARQTHLATWLETMLQDIRYAMRTLRKSPAFTLVAVSSLALGIGLNTAVFSLIDTLLFRRVKLVDTERLVSLYRVSAKGEGPRGWFPYPVIQQLRDSNHVFAGMAASTMSGFSVSFDGAPPQMVSGGFYSDNYYALLGVQPWLGRAFTPQDDQPGAAPVAMISYDYWQDNFSASSGALGRTIEIKGTPFQIIGVVPPGFTGLTMLDHPPKVALPLTWYASLKLNDNELSANIVGRLKPGTPLAQAAAEANLILHRMPPELLRPDWSEDLQRGILSDSIELHPRGKGDEWGWENYKLRLSLLMSVVGLVLLIACANVANLLLARGSARRQEIAVRLAIGAARSRVVRQLLTESLLLAGLGGVVGLGLAVLAHRVLARQLELNSGFILDWRVLVFTAGVGLVAGAFFGLAPAFRGTRVDLNPGLKGESRPAANAGLRSRFVLGKGLVGLQVALSLTLIVGTGLLVQTLRNLTHVDPGFDQENVLLFWIYPTTLGYHGTNELRLYDEYLRHFNTVPGVVKASMVRHHMMQGAKGFVRVSSALAEGVQAPESLAAFNTAAPDFFATMRIPLLAGRDFSVHDGATNTKVAIVDQKFAVAHFGSENPLGKHILVHRGADSTEWEIVGIVRDVRFAGVRQDDDVPSQEVFVPYTQAPASMLGQMCFTLRTASNPAGVFGAVRREAQAVDKNLPLGRPFTQAEVAEGSIHGEHSLAILIGSFSTMAVLLACIGLYGVMAYAVSRRTREIGVRMALGAAQFHVRLMFLRESGLLVSMGIVGGAGIALATNRLLGSVLYGVRPYDAATFLLGTLLLVAVAALAAYLPARRASHVDPIVALRNE